jgi:hypothetical protein
MRTRLQRRIGGCKVRAAVGGRRRPSHVGDRPERRGRMPAPMLNSSSEDRSDHRKGGDVHTRASTTCSQTPNSAYFSTANRSARARATRFGVNGASNREDSCYLPVFKRRAAKGGHRERAAPSVTSDSGRRNRSARRFRRSSIVPREQARSPSAIADARRNDVVSCRQIV